MSLRLLVLSLWFRRGASATLFIAAALTVVAATTAPTWSNASEQSLLLQALRSSDASDTSYSVMMTANTAMERGAATPVPVAVDDVLRDSVLPGGLERRFAEPTLTLASIRRVTVSPTPVRSPAATDIAEPQPVIAFGRLLWRAGICDEVRLLAGACPASSSEVMLSERSAAELGVALRQDVRLRDLVDEPPPAGQRLPFLIDYTVSGLYVAEEGDHVDPDLVDFRPGTVLGGDPIPPRLDAVVVSKDLMLSLQELSVQVTANRSLVPGAVGLADADEVQKALAAHTEEAVGRGAGIEHRAPLTDLLADVAGERELVHSTALLASAQVVLLGWVMVFTLVGVSLTAREPEIALTKLRGMPTRKVVTAVVAEPVTLLLLAVPVGVVGGLVGVELLQRHVFTNAASVDLTLTTGLYVAATVLGAVLAVGLAAVRSVRAPVLDQLRRSGTTTVGAGGRIVDVAVISIAVAAASVVVSVGRQAAHSTLGALMPTLVGVAVGLLLARLLAHGARLTAEKRTRAALPAFLALRQVARRAGSMRLAALVTALVTFVTFAAASWSIATEQRRHTSGMHVGAAQVVAVGGRSPTELMNATTTADPHGNWAMAVIEAGSPPGRGVDRMLAADMTRFHTAAWPAADHVALSQPVVDAVSASTAAPSLDVHGTAWQLDVDLEHQASELELAVSIHAVTFTGKILTVGLGQLESGRQTLRANVPACAHGCTVDRMRIVRVAGSVGPMLGTVVLEAFRVDGRLLEDFGTESHWRATRLDEEAPQSSAASAKLEQRTEGLAISFNLPPSGTPGIARRDVPEVVHAAVARSTALQQTGFDGLVAGASLGDASPPLEVVAVVPALPRLGTEGALVDLRVIGRVDSADRDDLVHQVWLSDAAPPDAVDRLRAAGLEVLHLETASMRFHELGQGGAALGLVLLVLAAGIVLAAGLASVSATIAAAARTRSVESAALRALTVSDRAIRHSLRTEHALLLLPPVLLGALAGGLTAVAAAEMMDPAGSAVSPVLVTSASVWTPVVASAAATGLLLYVLSWAARRIHVAMGRVDRLKESQP